MRAAIVWFLYKAWQLFDYLFSKREAWVDGSTRNLRFLIAAAAPLALIVHLTMEAYQLGGWGKLLDKSIEGFKKSYEVGDHWTSIFAYMVALVWLCGPFLILLKEQLSFRTREALTVILVTAAGMIVVEVITFVYAGPGSRGWAFWLNPFIFYLPMVVVGLLAARLTESIYEPKTGAEEVERDKR